MCTVNIEELKRKVQEYINKRGGRIYAPIMHPDFLSIPTQHGHERFDCIAKHVQSESRSLLDIGSHWGYFAHRFEDMGLKVTAVENNQSYLYFLRSFRTLCGKKFEIWDKSIFELENMEYDIVLALNIFHHFIKERSVYISFDKFLSNLKCKKMFFQSHNPDEGQMKKSFLNLEQDKFAEFVASRIGLSSIEHIDTQKGRYLWMIS